MSWPTRPLALHHLAVLVRDLPRAEAFYAGVLGLAVDRRWDDERGAPRSVWLTLGGGAFLALELAPRDAADELRGERAGYHCVSLAIGTEEREPLRAHLASAGFPVIRETAFTLYARDPEGNLLGFSHFPARAEASS